MKKFQNSKLARILLLTIIMTVVVITILFLAGKFSPQKLTAQQFVNLQQGDNTHAGFRRAHAKGICIFGDFESNGNLASYSSATLFEKRISPFIGRFSIAGSNPTAPDLKAPVRSLAFVLNNDTNQEWRVAMNTPPVMAVTNPYDFFEQIQALSPDPITKKPDPEKIKAFFKEHPESKAFNDWKANYVPTNSFATEQYHSINAFYLIDKSGHKQAVRWVAVPQATKESLPKLDVDSADALQIQLSKILKNNTIKFDLVFTLANAQDDENNPTIPWPDEREKVTAGTLNIISWEAQQNGKCADKNFDPLVLPDGIRATADPILRARGAAYAESFRRRAKEVLLGTQEIVRSQVGNEQ
ncbi:hypothetical protein LCGC14_0505270 [marine sediment metagenome]|uniref:Catalase core domain-containing protein n=1 Tax=marine sediment metagenome TaxID=412755 RepID=A0A0F9VB94_9ZZZZ